MSFYRRLLQRLAFSKSRNFNRDKDPTNTMAYDKDKTDRSRRKYFSFGGNDVLMDEKAGLF